MAPGRGQEGSWPCEGNGGEVGGIQFEGTQQPGQLQACNTTVLACTPPSPLFLVESLPQNKKEEGRNRQAVSNKARGKPSPLTCHKTGCNRDKSEAYIGDASDSLDTFGNSYGTVILWFFFVF